MSDLINITQVNPIDFTYQEYSSQDEMLISSFLVSSSFDQNIDNIELFLFDFNKNIIFSNYEYSNFSLLNSELFINPQEDINQLVGEDGLYYIVYNFLSNRLNSSFLSLYYISEISSDRTEIRLDSNTIPNIDIISGSLVFINERNSTTNYELDFYLNFGNNQLVIANNILLDTSVVDDPTVLIKLYEPLPQQFNLKDECWVTVQIAESLAYEATYEEVFNFQETIIPLRGPNLNLDINNQINNSTDYSSQSDLKTNTSSSYQYQLNSFLAERGLQINIDYNDFSNFIFFSSAQRRIENFYYKLQLIEEYSYSGSLSGNTPTNTYSSASNNLWQIKVQDVIDNFDHYEYYLYYDSGSSAWPKTNPLTGPPYVNVSTTSVAGVTWLTEYLASGSDYDNNNDNYLYNTIPTYLSQDVQNEPLELFVDMLAQSFDDTWIYLKDVTNKWDADNRINYGVSKDIVADVIRDLGIKIYQNNFSVANLYQAFLGFDPSGSYTFPYDATGSLPVTAGSGLEYVNNYITASNEAVPLDDVNKRIYKRIYHNLPYLLKTKGTITGLKTLITSYGIPDTILRVNEFGGKDKLNVSDWDYWQRIFDYSLNTSTVASAVSSSWGLNGTWASPNDVPASLQFRFKLPSTGSSGAITYAVANPSQSLWSLDNGTNVAVVLEYTGSGFTSSSYSGSITDPYNQYGTLKFTANGTTSASVYLPFFNGDWWSVMVTRTGSIFNLYAANSIYNGDDGAQIGYIASSSFTNTASIANWTGSNVSYFSAVSNSISLGGKTYNKFSGSYQEVRYYTTALNVGPFQDYVMNPQSTEGNGVNTTPDTLAFRAALGGELYTSSISIHPKVTGSWVTTSSFASNSNFHIGSGTSFIVNRGYTFYDQPIAGIQNAISNKIKNEGLILPSGNTLSAFRSIQQTSPLSGSYTANVNYLEVAFSPQNEINEDIMDQIGFLNLGEYIGDPRQRFTQEVSYPDLDALRNIYFEKYKSNYDINDYVRLIKYFDNSLFKMIKDFVPARTGLAAGIVIKQHLLERNKYPQPEVEWAIYDYSGSIPMGYIVGGAGGSVNNLNTPWYHFSASIAFGAVDAAYGSLYIGGNIDPISAGFFSFDGSVNQGTFTNQTGQGLEVRFRVTLDNTDLPTAFSCSYSSSTQVVDFPPIDLPADGVTYETFSPYISIPNNETFKFIIKDNGSAGITINNVSTTIVGQSLINPYAGQVWKETIINPYGTEITIHSSQDEFYNGEFSGSEFVVENGELNEANPVKQVETTPLFYSSTGSATATNPGAGQFFWRAAGYPVGGALTPDGPAGLKYIYINETDANGVNILQALQNLNPGDSMTFTIVFDTGTPA